MRGRDSKDKNTRVSGRDSKDKHKTKKESYDQHVCTVGIAKTNTRQMKESYDQHVCPVGIAKTNTRQRRNHTTSIAFATHTQLSVETTIAATAPA